jgi:cell division protein FtsQ
MKIRKKRGRNRRRTDPFVVRAKRFLLRSLKVFILAAVVPVLALSGWKLYNLFITTEYLEIKTINVVGARRVGLDEAVALSGIRKGENLFSFKYSQAIKGLKTHPWVASAELRRSPPHTVSIELKEREPIALVKTDAMYLMDAAGNIFARYSSADSVDLPVVTGLERGKPGGGGRVPGSGPAVDASVLELIRVLDGRIGFNLRNVSEINVDPEYGLTLYTLVEGVRLELGSGAFEKKLRAFEKVVRARGGSLQGIEAINLKSDHEVVVKLSGDVNVIKGGGAT